MKSWFSWEKSKFAPRGKCRREKDKKGTRKKKMAREENKGWTICNIVPQNDKKCNDQCPRMKSCWGCPVKSSLPGQLCCGVRALPGHGAESAHDQLLWQSQDPLLSPPEDCDIQPRSFQHAVTALNREYSPCDYITNFSTVTAAWRNIR